MYTDPAQAVAQQAAAQSRWMGIGMGSRNPLWCCRVTRPRLGRVPPASLLAWLSLVEMESNGEMVVNGMPRKRGSPHAPQGVRKGGEVAEQTPVYSAPEDVLSIDGWYCRSRLRREKRNEDSERMV